MSIRLEINNATKEKIDAKILKTAVKVFGEKMKINAIYLVILMIFISGCAYSARPPLDINIYPKQPAY